MNKLSLTCLAVSSVLASSAVSAQSTDYQSEGYAGETGFGQKLYSEPTTATRQEIINLLDEGFPSQNVFLMATAMGLSIDEVLEAAINNNREYERDYTTSALSILPYYEGQPQLTDYYSSYSADELSGSRDVDEVIRRVFLNREALALGLDWQSGFYHLASPEARLQQIAAATLVNDDYWYRRIVNNEGFRATPFAAGRPAFVSLYPEIKGASGTRSNDYYSFTDFGINPDVSRTANGNVPVVFVYNRDKERPAGEFPQPLTVENIVNRYHSEGIMLTPVPDWRRGDYHGEILISELERFIDLPEVNDFERDEFAQLQESIRANGISESLVAVVLPATGQVEQWGAVNGESKPGNPESGLLYASLGSAVSRDISWPIGVARPDIVLAAKLLGYTRLPMAFYYVDNERIHHYLGGAALLAALCQSCSGSMAATGDVPIKLPPLIGTGSSGGGFGPTPQSPPPIIPPPPPPPPPTPPPPTTFPPPPPPPPPPPMMPCPPMMTPDGSPVCD